MRQGPNICPFHEIRKHPLPLISLDLKQTQQQRKNSPPLSLSYSPSLAHLKKNRVKLSSLDLVSVVISLDRGVTLNRKRINRAHKPQFPRIDKKKKATTGKGFDESCEMAQSSFRFVWSILV
ncbi:uncharacterized protein LOC131648542 [Vicia villosa]|uniref:uncharacterized protein LOC131648542 n=1 Tax=Vicia villosa TaxID=3911 RepID=UPI00273BC04D|nr:uncharacterized protein LOC131648542 [Vicia villosa]